MTPEVEAPLVLVVTGTDTHPFDRLVGWVDDWLRVRSGSPVRCVVQYGTSRAPDLAEGSAFMDHPTLEELMTRSTVIVTHGGPTTISEARRIGHRPLVVARRSSLGEHVDDHQVRFTSRLSEASLIDAVHSRAELTEAIESRLRSDVSVAPRDERDSRAAALALGDIVDEVMERRGRAPTGSHWGVFRRR